MLHRLVVSTPLKNISQNGNLAQVGVNIKNIWNHHLVQYRSSHGFYGYQNLGLKPAWYTPYTNPHLRYKIAESELVETPHCQAVHAFLAARRGPCQHCASNQICKKYWKITTTSFFGNRNKFGVIAILVTATTPSIQKPSPRPWCLPHRLHNLAKWEGP